VHEAVAQLVAERGSAAVNVADVAAASGVHPTSIYRRWGTLEGLLLDVALARIEKDAPIPDKGSLRSDLLAFAKQASTTISGPDGFALLRAIIAMDDVQPDRDGVRSASRARLLARRGAQLQEMLDRAKARGERPLEFTDVLDGLLAPIYMRFLFGVGGVDRAYLAHLVDRLVMAPSRARRGRRK
jgi:AcrR family transcriptional regulator